MGVPVSVLFCFIKSGLFPNHGKLLHLKDYGKLWFKKKFFLNICLVELPFKLVPKLSGSSPSHMKNLERTANLDIGEGSMYEKDDLCNF